MQRKKMAARTKVSLCIWIILSAAAVFSVSADEAVLSSGTGPLSFSFEPKKVFIVGSSDEGESITFNIGMENRTEIPLTIEKLFLGFKKKGQRIIVKEQSDAFFRQGLIVRERKIQANSNVRWSAICLTGVSFGLIDEIELVFRLKGRKKFRAEQSLQIPVSRYTQKTELRLPFKERWRVTQGHQCKSNHRISGYGGDFAWDFTALGAKGNIADEEYYRKRENRYSYSFGREILAPAPGRIVKVMNEMEDNEGLLDYPRKSLEYEVENPLWVFGNYVIIDHKNGEFSLLGHMLKGSIAVKEGDEVETMSVIGKCGNSGNSYVPHLHYQLMDGIHPMKYEVNGLPASFSTYAVLKPPSQFSEDLSPQDLFLKREEVKNGSPEQDMILQSD